MPCDELRCAEQVYLITKPAEQFNIDIPHTQQLPKIMPPQFSSKKIECEYHKNTSVIIIYKGNVFVNKKVSQKGVKKVSTFNTQ